jgi:hypothetical protein
MEKRLQWHVEETQATISKTMGEFTSRLTKLDEVSRSGTEALVDHDQRIAAQMTKIDEAERMATANGAKLEKCIVDLDGLQLSKTDQMAFDVYMESLDQKMANVNEYTEITRNMVLGCENYLEKYQPLFTHR